MSIISTNHDVVNYDPKKSSAFEGQRLAKIIARNRGVTEGTDKKESKCVSVPRLTADTVIDSIETLMPVILSSLQDTQDKIIRELVSAGSTFIPDEQISISAICSYHAEESTGSRLTKELISAWFDENVSDSLTGAVALKLNISDTPAPEEEIRVLSIVSEYRNKFSSLAGGKTSYSPEVADRLKKALEISGCSDEIAEKFTVRLEGMKTAKNDILLDL